MRLGRSARGFIALCLVAVLVAEGTSNIVLPQLAPEIIGSTARAGASGPLNGAVVGSPVTSQQAPDMVSRTVVLSNNSLVEGNFQPTPCIGYTGLAIVPSRSRVFISCIYSSSVAILNASSGLSDGLSEVGQDPSNLTYVSANNGVYVVNTNSDNVTELSGSTGRVSANIPVGSSPTGITYDPAAQAIFVSNAASGNLTEIATATNTVIANYPMGASSQPGPILYNPVDGLLFVGDSAVGRVLAVSPDNGTIAYVVRVALPPSGIGYNPLNGDVYVGTWNQNVLYDQVAVIPPSSHHVSANITVGYDPTSIQYDPGAGTLLVTNLGSNNVSVVDPASGHTIRSIEVGLAPVDIAVSGGVIYVANSYSSNLAVVNGSTFIVDRFWAYNTGPGPVQFDGDSSLLVANWNSGDISALNTTTLAPELSLPVWDTLTGLTLDPQDGRAYASCVTCSAVYPVNLSTGAGQPIGVGQDPLAVFFDPSNGMVYSANSVPNNLSVIDPSTDSVVDTISLAGFDAGGGTPVAFASNPSNGSLYVAVHGNLNFNPGNITIIDPATNKVVSAILDWGGPGPSALAFDARNHELYVTDDYANAVWAFNTSTEAVISITPVGSAPEGIAIDPSAGLVYVSNSRSANLTVINDTTNRVVESIAVGQDPQGVCISPSGQTVYVANQESGTISVITAPKLYSATFSETGLPSSLNWSVEVAGHPASSPGGDSITFELGNGTYGYVIGGVSGWHQGTLPYRGSLTISGAPVVEPTLIFSHVAYTVTFIPEGLSPWDVWSVTLNGTIASGGSALAFPGLPNGTYTFNDSSSGYATSPATGEITVAGSNVSQSISLTPVIGRYQVTFSEFGLPSSSRWTIMVRNSSGFDRTSVTNVSVVQLYLFNGSYTYTLNATAPWVPADGQSGNFVVAGASTSIIARFNFTYNVTFTQAGIPNGTAWWLNVSQQVNTMESDPVANWSLKVNGDSATLELWNGSYSYSIQCAGFVPATGSLHLVGKPTVIAVNVTAEAASGGTSWLPIIIVVVLAAGATCAIVIGLIWRRSKRRPRGPG